MAGLVPAIHVFSIPMPQDVDARVKPAHDEGDAMSAPTGARGLWKTRPGPMFAAGIAGTGSVPPAWLDLAP